MNKIWERIFYVLSFIVQGSSYLNPRTYAIMHRMHHAYADTDKDPHSPNNYSNVFSMMWSTAKFYHVINNGTLKVEERFLKNLPSWNSFEKLADTWVSRIFWGLVYVVFYYFFAPSAWWYLLLPVHFVMGPFHGVIINWFAHKHFYINFKLSNTSRNLLPIDILMLGESYHNNHHKFPSNINFGSRWFELDPVYPFILLFNRMRIIRIRKVTEERVITEF